MKIYLASASLARKKLLKDLGIKFIVFPSKAKEKFSTKGPYELLAKQNALKKAKDVASRVKEGVIIAADTFSVCVGKVFGKPRNLADARRMLKSSSRNPQVVYSGVCVIKKTVFGEECFLECEKTKVYMDSLTDKDINEYFSKVSPLDKAGSFDIQGRGAMFIKRIEGCFYNVVGLPLNRLFRMLNKAGVRVLFLFLSFSFLLSGCSTEYNMVTGEQETYFYSTDHEVQLGRSIAKQVEKEYKLVEDPLIQKRVEDVGMKVARVCDRRDIDYTFKVLDEDEVNAVSLPGGFVYVFKGLVEKTKTDDELAGVLAHEVGHIVARHSVKKLQGLQGYSVLRLLIAVAPQTSQVGAAADTAFTELMLGYSREDELLADQLGARYTKLAGYNPKGMIKFLKTLEDVHRRSPPTIKSYYKTHPYVPDRIRVVKEEIGEEIDFKDYINIEQDKHQ